MEFVSSAAQYRACDSANALQNFCIVL